MAQTTPPTDPAGEPGEAPPPARGLKIAVIVMGVILIFGFLTVFITIGYRIANPPDGSLAAAAVDGGRGYESEVEIPAGGALESFDVVDGRGVARLRLADGRHEIVVLDLGRGRVVGRFTLVPR